MITKNQSFPFVKALKHKKIQCKAQYVKNHT